MNTGTPKVWMACGGLVLYACIGGVGVVALGTAAGLGPISFLLIGAVIGLVACGLWRKRS